MITLSRHRKVVLLKNKFLLISIVRKWATLALPGVWCPDFEIL